MGFPEDPYMFVSDILIRKLERFTLLSASDKQAIGCLPVATRRVNARIDILHRGKTPDMVGLLGEGFACRYKYSAAGRRQIIAFLIPGDLANSAYDMARPPGFSVATLTPATIVDIPRPALLELARDRPPIAAALAEITSMETETLNQWLVNVGRRDARERLAHLICEILCRLRAIGRAEGDLIEVPLTQKDLADALGLTPVHVSRTLQQLRKQKLVERVGRALRIDDFARLAKLAHFNPDYLDDSPRREFAALQNVSVGIEYSTTDG